MAAGEKQHTNNEELLQMAIKAAKSGQKDGARVMLRQVWSRNKRDERAMIWLAKVANTPEERREWLNRVLQVNPENETAKKALAQMKRQDAATDNRLLVVFGAVAVVMVVLVVAVLILFLAS